MIIKCKYCLPLEGVILPKFNKVEKEIIIELTSKLGLFTVKYLMEVHSLSQRDAKFITAHVNTELNRCCKCSSDELIGEHCICSKCKAFNLNWEGLFKEK
jgi:hypothetical protein